jgi:hypothetical protein
MSNFRFGILYAFMIVTGGVALYLGEIQAAFITLVCITIIIVGDVFYTLLKKIHDLLRQEELVVMDYYPQIPVDLFPDREKRKY